MMIQLQAVSKRFNYDWIFRNLDYTFSAGDKIAITGANGSGKSTLMRILSGQLSPSEGSVAFTFNGGKLAPDMVYSKISYAAPYIDLIEEFSFAELLHFQKQFKPTVQNLPVRECIAISGLERHRNKLIKNYSSGMKQRVKLSLAILADVPVVLLDEPTTNLDAAGVAWYQELIGRYGGDRCIVVSSNITREYEFCEAVIQIEKYKR